MKLFLHCRTWKQLFIWLFKTELNFKRCCRLLYYNKTYSLHYVDDVLFLWVTYNHIKKNFIFQIMNSLCHIQKVELSPSKWLHMDVWMKTSAPPNLRSWPSVAAWYRRLESGRCRSLKKTLKMIRNNNKEWTTVSRWNLS